MSLCLPHEIQRFQPAWIVLSLIGELSACAAGQGQNPPVDLGETVSALDQAIFYVFQAKNDDYWFGSWERGVYRYDGKTLVNYTTKDGLVGNQSKGFQEDKAGNIYITTMECDSDGRCTQGISRFDGRTLNALAVTESASSGDGWKLQPDDLWFCGAQDTGAVYRYDGKSLQRLEFPKTRDGDEQIAKYPRSEYPNAKFSPYDVYTIYQDSQGNLWFGTATLGACRYDGKSFAWLSESELRNGSFGTRSIVEDRDGRFWFCDPVRRYKIDLSNPAAPKFKAVDGLRDATDPTRTPFDGIMSSTRDRDGALWMATYGEGVWRYDGQSVTHFPVLDGDKAITLFSIHQDNRGVMWLGTHSAGAYKFNGKTFEKFRP